MDPENRTGFPRTGSAVRGRRRIQLLEGGKVALLRRYYQLGDADDRVGRIPVDGARSPAKRRTAACSPAHHWRNLSSISAALIQETTTSRSAELTGSGSAMRLMRSLEPTPVSRASSTAAITTRELTYLSASSPPGSSPSCRRSPSAGYADGLSFDSARRIVAPNSSLHRSPSEGHSRPSSSASSRCRSSRSSSRYLTTLVRQS